MVKVGLCDEENVSRDENNKAAVDEVPLFLRNFYGSKFIFYYENSR